MRRRPLPVTLTIFLLAPLSFGNLLTPVMMPEAEGLLFVLGVLGLLSAAGPWILKRWALWLTIVVSVLNILTAAPGIVFPSAPTARVLAAVGVVGFALVILLVVLPNSRRAYT